MIARRVVPDTPDFGILTQQRTDQGRGESLHRPQIRLAELYPGYRRFSSSTQLTNYAGWHASDQDILGDVPSHHGSSGNHCPASN